MSRPASALDQSFAGNPGATLPAGAAPAWQSGLGSLLGAARGSCDGLAGDLKVWMDPRQVRQVLLNLMRNAIEVMPHGGRLDLSARVEGRDAVVEVRDSGPGIPADQRALVFEPFFSTKPHGTGLGLALARRIADEHGGALELAVSQQGACFRLRLPLADAPGETELPALVGAEAAP